MKAKAKPPLPPFPDVPVTDLDPGPAAGLAARITALGWSESSQPPGGVLMLGCGACGGHAAVPMGEGEPVDLPAHRDCPGAPA